MSDTQTLGEAGTVAGLSTLSRVYCGMSRSDGSQIPQCDVNMFAADTVARYFPDGWSVIWVNGGWGDTATGETIQEPSAIIELAHGAQDGDRVLAIARAYKARFGQQAVMVTSSPVNTTFV